MLNRLTQASTLPDHHGSPVRYNHTKLVDSFYAVDGSERDKIRVTRDEQSGSVKAIRKIRLGDLNIYSAKHTADWRISVNVELPVNHPVGSPTHVRRKDRMSYSHEEVVIDLTQVSSQTSQNTAPQINHELEIEIARPELLVATAMKRDDPNVSEFERSAFDELIRVFVNNARILVKNSTPDWR